MLLTLSITTTYYYLLLLLLLFYMKAITITICGSPTEVHRAAHGGVQVQAGRRRVPGREGSGVNRGRREHMGSFRGYPTNRGRCGVLLTLVSCWQQIRAISPLNLPSLCTIYWPLLNPERATMSTSRSRTATRRAPTRDPRAREDDGGF